MKRASVCVVTCVVSCVVLAACSENSSTVATDVATTNVATTSAAAEPTQSTTPTDGSVQILVVVGDNTAPDRVEKIALGSSVTVTFVNPASHDDFHLHGYDLSTGSVEAGETSVMSFTADKAGTFEIESHESGDVLVVLEIA